MYWSIIIVLTYCQIHSLQHHRFSRLWIKCINHITHIQISSSSVHRSTHSSAASADRSGTVRWRTSPPAHRNGMLAAAAAAAAADGGGIGHFRRWPKAAAVERRAASIGDRCASTWWTGGTRRALHSWHDALCFCGNTRTAGWTLSGRCTLERYPGAISWMKPRGEGRTHAMIMMMDVPHTTVAQKATIKTDSIQQRDAIPTNTTKKACNTQTYITLLLMSIWSRWALLSSI